MEGFPLMQDEAGVDEFFDAGAAEFRAVGGDDAIEAVAGFVERRRRTEGNRPAASEFAAEFFSDVAE